MPKATVNNLLRERVEFLGKSINMEHSTAPVLRCEWHYHPEMEFTAFLHATRGICLCGNISVPFETGDVFFTPPNVPHQTIFSADKEGKECDIVTFKLSLQLLGSNLFALPEFKQVADLLNLVTAKKAIRVRMSNEWLQRLPSLQCLRDTERLLEFLRILGELAKEPFREIHPLHDSSPMDVPVPSRTNQDMYHRLARALNYIQQNLTSKLSVGEAAAHAQMPVETFRRFFRRSLNVGFPEYVVKSRIAHAEQLLLTTSRSILEIAMATGFRNLSNFNRLFLKYCHCTPSQYRRNV